MIDVRRILVVVAHPDDAEFGCGGSVARWVADGCEVVYCLLTSGNRGSDDPTMLPEQLAVIRVDKQRAAARVLGVKDVVFLGYPDGELEDTRDAISTHSPSSTFDRARRARRARSAGHAGARPGVDGDRAGIDRDVDAQGLD